VKPELGFQIARLATSYLATYTFPSYGFDTTPYAGLQAAVKVPIDTV
jgi:hypothetical protein